MFDVEKRVACNTPEGYTMWSVAYPGRRGGPQLVSWEVAMGVTDISEGGERFSVPGGLYVLLRHPNEAPFHFKVPLRPVIVLSAPASEYYPRVIYFVFES